MEIAYHTENKLGQGKVLHYHTYTPGFSETKNGSFDRSDASIIGIYCGKKIAMLLQR